ncbi:unnamed protein product [Vitrella brassicaformis CCMP3155]|uniref:Uncharacterized protein n=1 Tax=Vitrella brassicaformis (strain CCMP3155) TaxID=1169540 RepID=A0A0G4EV57_VITBC|nr:unnamed protein product [Vitrella brassicaformis CCMP3155]|eukprot:CEM02496.1 unnamed protein product [Vitrella brassicaformis CCMP3155]
MENTDTIRHRYARFARTVAWRFPSFVASTRRTAFANATDSPPDAAGATSSGTESQHDVTADDPDSQPPHSSDASAAASSPTEEQEKLLKAVMGKDAFFVDPRAMQLMREELKDKVPIMIALVAQLIAVIGVFAWRVWKNV